MDRLLELELMSYLFEIIMTTKDKDFLNITLKTVVALTQWVRIGDFAEPQVAAKLRELKSEDAIYVLNAFDSNPKPRPAKKWPILNLTGLESFLETNEPDTNLKNLYGMSCKRILQPSSNESYNKDNSPAMDYYQTKEYRPSEYIKFRNNFKKPGQMANTVNPAMEAFTDHRIERNETPLKRLKFTTDYSTGRVESNSGKTLNLPLLSTVHTFDPKEYIGHMDQLYEKYMDTDLTEKLMSEGKIARKLLGIGVIEAAGIKKATSYGTIRKLMEWYASSKDYTKAYSLILYGTITTKKADRVISLLHLIATIKMSYSVKNPHVISS